MEEHSLLVEVCSILASTTSLVVILSPSMSIYRIHKTRAVGTTSVIALVSMLANSHLWMMYGYLIDNIFPVFTTFLIGDVISLVYLAIYVRWSIERAYVYKVIGCTVAALSLVSVYVLLGALGATHQPRHDVISVVGYIAAAMTIMLYTSPFEKVRLVLKHRTAVFIPIHLVVAGTTNNAVWVVYTLVDSNWFMFVPEVVCFTCGIIQIGLYLIYHPKTHPLMSSAEGMSSKHELVVTASQAILSPDVTGGKTPELDDRHSNFHAIV